MKSVSKEKRSQLILVVLLTAGVLAGIWFGVIRFQQQRLATLAQSKIIAQNKLDQVRQAIDSADLIEIAPQRSQPTLIETRIVYGQW